ncbi:MAG: tripartite tricarboxylate transporter TctB family protein [Rhodospirillales bacterium]
MSLLPSTSPAGQRPPTRIADVIAGIGAILIGLFFLIFAFEIDQEAGQSGGPRLVPLIASAALVIIGLTLTGFAFLLAPAGGKQPGAALSAGAVLLAVGGLGYCALIWAFGYLPATLVAAPLGFMIFGCQGRRGAILPGLATAIISYLLFFELLGIYAPPGHLIDLSLLLT